MQLCLKRYGILYRIKTKATTCCQCKNACKSYKIHYHMKWMNSLLKKLENLETCMFIQSWADQKIYPVQLVVINHYFFWDARRNNNKKSCLQIWQKVLNDDILWVKMIKFCIESWKVNKKPFFFFLVKWKFILHL